MTWLYALLSRITSSPGHTPLRVAFRRPWPGTLRGLVLWFFALGIAVLGAINYALTAPPSSTSEALVVAVAIMPLRAWGWVMVGTGAIAAWSSYCHHDRDKYGYVTLAVFCWCWGASLVTGWLFFDAPIRALGSSIVWLLFSAALVTSAGHARTPLRIRDRVGSQ